MRVLALLLALTLGTAVLTGCESTFDKAEKAREAAGTVAQVDAMSMTQLPGVSAETEAILPSSDGMTTAVVFKITAKDPGKYVLWAPIEVKLLDAAGKEVGTNNIPGAIPLLVHLPSIDGGSSAVYVNDQILTSGKAATAKVTVGGAFVPGKGPGLLQTTPPKLVKDPNLGDSWTTTVTNTTSVRQQAIIVQAIVTKDGKVVGAGTANVDGLDPGASADVTGYFIGSSSGTLSVTAPASNAADGSGAPGSETAGGGAASTAPAGDTSSVSTPTMTLQIN